MKLTTAKSNLNPVQVQCVSLTVLWICTLEALIWALDDGKRDPHQIKREALQIIYERPSELYPTIAKRDRVLAGNAMLLYQFIVTAANELQRHFDTQALAWWESRLPPVWSSMEPDGAWLASLKALQIDKLADYVLTDPADLQGDAVLNVEEKFKQYKNQAAIELPERIFFTPLKTSSGVIAELQGDRWEFWKAERNRMMMDYLLQIMPLASGFNPVKVARDGYRATLSQRDAKRRGGTGGRHARARGTDTAPVVEIEAETAPLTAPGSTVEEQTDARIMAASCLRQAGKRWGLDGDKFLRALAEGSTIEKAAAEAGISLRTANRWLRTLRDLPDT
jgi:hypothetical protein